MLLKKQLTHNCTYYHAWPSRPTFWRSFDDDIADCAESLAFKLPRASGLPTQALAPKVCPGARRAASDTSPPTRSSLADAAVPDFARAPADRDRADAATVAAVSGGLRIGDVLEGANGPAIGIEGRAICTGEDGELDELLLLKGIECAIDDVRDSIGTLLTGILT